MSSDFPSVEIRFFGPLLPVVDALVLCPLPMMCKLTFKEGAATDPAEELSIVYNSLVMAPFTSVE